MRSFLRIGLRDTCRMLRIFVLFVSLFMIHPAAASPSATEKCQAPDMNRPGRLNWFAGFSAADDLLTAWCRIQSLGGSRVRFNVLFPNTKVHRSWDTSFNGQPLPAARIVELIQTLLPTGDGPAADENGMEFHRVLLNVVQAGAAEAPDGTILGFPPSHPASRELILHEPVVLRLKPVVLAGQEFTLNVVLRPNLGMFSLAMQGKATDVRLLGWKKRMEIGSLFGSGCSSQIPFCREIPEVATFHAPWVVTGVRLDASGENLTQSAIRIINHLGISQSAFIKGDLFGNFDRSTGQGSLTMSDGISVMRFVAKGGAAGTRSIMIAWEETKHRSSYANLFRSIFEEFRAGSKTKSGPDPTIPDNLGRL